MEPALNVPKYWKGKMQMEKQWFNKTVEDVEKELEIDLEKGSVLELTKYMPDTTYYYDVSAYLLKENDYKKTALFDAGNSKDQSPTDSVFEDFSFLCFWNCDCILDDLE